ncbi:MAG: hypothetical protein DRI34_02320 [Deltaproteobacteria bacterium]|nr:MAG: hypothetical protein DRI34_02320 [Deltaproteobacteria bacterium]
MNGGGFLANLAEILLQGGGYMILGFGLAGMVQELFSRYRLARFFGGSPTWQAAKGVLAGAPLPVCSCGVVPVSLALSRAAVPRPALMSFLIATPETGLVSILLSLALLGPLFAWLRPLVAIVTAFLAGCLIAFWDRRYRDDRPATPPTPREDDSHSSSAGRSWSSFLRRSLRIGFVEILDDVSFWLVAGIVISAALGTLLPPHALLHLNPWLALGLALLAGLPLYMCAVASTPIALALLAKGLAPGAALVFLLVGPATNIGTISLLYKFFGKRFVLVYLAVVSVCALAAGAVLNLLAVPVSLPGLAVTASGGGFSWFSWMLAGLLLLLLLVSLWRTGLATGLGELFSHLDQLTLGAATPCGLALLRAGRALLAWFRVSLPRRLAQAALLLVLVLLGQSIFLRVPVGHQAFVERFGRIVSGPLAAGLHLKLPWPLERGHVRPSRRLQQLQVGFHVSRASTPAGNPPLEIPVGSLDTHHSNATVLTADELLVEIPFTVRFRIRDPRRYHFQFSQARQLLQSLAEEAVRESARATSFSAIVSRGRAEFAASCNRRLQSSLRQLDLGIELLGIVLVDSHPQADTADAFRAVSDALEDRATRIELARARRIEMISGARGQAAGMLAEAHRKKATTLAEARGRALSFAGLRQAYRLTPRLTRLRLRLEAAARALTEASKWILPEQVGTPDLWFWLPPWVTSSGGK